MIDYGPKYYKNGNYIVQTSDLRLIKRTCRIGEDFKADFPDSIDLKISNRCSWGCHFCHESSVPDGKIFNLEKTKKVLSQLPELPIEIAIGGGNVFESPRETLQLINWLEDRGNQTRITLNIRDINNTGRLNKTQRDIINTVGGIGVSLDHLPNIILGPYSGETSLRTSIYSGDDSLYNNNLVVHIIAGVFPVSQLDELFEAADVPILILGYKQWGRAKDNKLPNSIGDFRDRIKQEIYRQRLENYDSFCRGITLGFDNLALEQLDIKSSLTDQEWKSIYMGDEGTHSMYVDAVKGEFARTSRSEERISWDSVGLLDYFKNL